MRVLFKILALLIGVGAIGYGLYYIYKMQKLHVSAELGKLAYLVDGVVWTALGMILVIMGLITKSS